MYYKYLTIHVAVRERFIPIGGNFAIVAKRFGWTKNVLMHQIEGKAFENYLLGQSNYDQTLTENVKNQAMLALRDDYT